MTNVAAVRRRPHSSGHSTRAANTPLTSTVWSGPYAPC